MCKDIKKSYYYYFPLRCLVVIIADWWFKTEAKCWAKGKGIPFIPCTPFSLAGPPNRMHAWKYYFFSSFFPSTSFKKIYNENSIYNNRTANKTQVYNRPWFYAYKFDGQDHYKMYLFSPSFSSCICMIFSLIYNFSQILPYLDQDF